MTRDQAFKDINSTQEYYVNELINALNNSNKDCFKEQNFTSDTGTGKTKMISMLCNKMPDKYFVITTLSKGQLQHQIRKNLARDIKQDNFVVYGLCDFTANTKLQAEDILARLPQNKDIIWLRDEGHIHTNRWQELINDRCWKIVNISATNKEEGIRCNFQHTMMLRTVNQQEGTPEEALDKLLEIKKQHKKVKNYNPCAIIRCLDDKLTQRVINACIERHFKYINITEEDFDMSDICEDNNEYDVIINKFKIVEGIDLRRAHVLYMTNEPTNSATTIQVIGRCRRNALLYRDDIDIFASENKNLLKNTRQCYVYFNVQNMKIDSDENGNLCMAFCNKISCEKLKTGSKIHVENGVMDNGLQVIELDNQTGDYIIEKDAETGFNVVKPEGDFYTLEKINHKNCIWRMESRLNGKIVHYSRYDIEDIKNILTVQEKTIFNYATGQYELLYQYYDLDEFEPIQTLTLTREEVNNFILYLHNKRQFKIIKQKQNNKSISLYYSDIELKFRYDIIFNENQILELKKQPDKLNKTLFNLFYLESSDKIKRFKSNEDLEQFIYKRKQTSIEDLNLLPINMGMDKQFEIKFRAGKKLIPIVDVKPISQNQVITSNKVPINMIDHLDRYYDYGQTIQDRESSIIGVDTVKSIKIDTGTIWVEDKAITSKIKKYCKFNQFIQIRYKKQIDSVKSLLYRGKNKFDLDTRCNSCLGYCAEYYGKYLVYGDLFLKPFIDKAKKESNVNYVNNFIIIRACMLMYKEMMSLTFGTYTAKLIRTISVQQLIQDKYKQFVDKVIELGTNIANFVRKEFNIYKPLEVGDKLYDPNLSINHIAGLADFITKDKIIDVKCTSSITLDYVKQVLAYHYLSTKRDDLDVKEVIIFDAVTNRSIKININ